MNTTSTGATSPSLSKSENEKQKEAELETDLDIKPYPYDDSHIYDEPVRSTQAQQPLPGPPGYKNVRSNTDAPPSYSSTVRFMGGATPLATSAGLEGLLSAGAAVGEQRETSNYSKLDTSTMSTLDYGNIGQREQRSMGSSSPRPDSDAVDYTNVVSHPAKHYPYAELSLITPTGSSLDDTNLSRNQGNGGNKNAESATNTHTENNGVQTSDTPARRQSDYQPLIASQRSSYGEYAEASPRHLSSPYDVPRRQSETLVSQQLQADGTPPTPLPTVGEAGGPEKEQYVNTTRQAVSDMQEYVEMLSSPQRK